MHHEAFALIAAAISTVVAAAGGILAQAAPDSTQTVAPWLYGGGSVAAVMCLAYIARQFANGSIVARDTAQLTAEASDREEQLSELVAAGHKREVDYLDLLRSNLRHEGRPPT